MAVSWSETNIIQYVYVVFVVRELKLHNLKLIFYIILRWSSCVVSVGKTLAQFNIYKFRSVFSGFYLCIFNVVFIIYLFVYFCADVFYVCSS